MSKRNSRAAKAARRQPSRVPAIPDISALAEAVHEAVCIATQSDGLGHCAAYAGTTMAVLCKATGQDWHIQAGSAFFGGTDDKGDFQFAWHSGATTPGIRPDGTEGPGGGLEHGELHAWAARSDDGETVSAIADFSARHVRACSEMIGIPVDPGPYVYGSPQELHARKIAYKADYPSTDLVISQIAKDGPAYADIAFLAMARAKLISPHQALGKLSSPALARAAEMLSEGWSLSSAMPGGFIMERD